MGLIPQRVKNMFFRRSAEDRMASTMMTEAEAKRWKKAADESGDAARLDLATKILTNGKLTADDRITAEAVAPQLFTLTTGDGEDPGFRRITSLATLRDLNPLMHDRMLQVCYFLRVTTPFGKRIVEILTEYTLGKGVRVSATDPRVQKVIDDFWKDDVNQMDENLEQWEDELTTFGELCVPVAVNPVSGKVRLGYIDPMNIDTIQFAEMATADGTASINVPFAVRLRREVGEVLQKPMLIVRRVEDVKSADYGQLSGECFYWTINKAKSASRGFSELFSLADWIDLFDQMIFDFGDKVRFLNSFVWHYVVKGGSDKTLAEFKDKLTKQPPKQGGVFVSNENVEVNAQTPDFKGQDMAAGAGMVNQYGWSGAGIPKVLTGDGDGANRATALEMNAPFVKKIMRKQNHLARCITQVLDFVLACAQRAGVLPAGADLAYAIEFPEIAVKDLQKGAQMLLGISTALTTGQAEGWVTGATAARAFHTLLAEVGVDIPNSQEEYDAAQQEQQDRADKQQNNLFPQSALGKALKSLQPNPADAAGDGADNDMLDEDEERDMVD